MHPSAQSDDVIREFIIECHENLDRIDGHLLALERGESYPDILANIFRTLHTIKGTCGFLALPTLEMVAHGGESVLSLLRDGVLQIDAETTDVLLRTVDAIRRLLAHIERHGDEGKEDHTDLLGRLARVSGKTAAGHTTPAPPPPTPILSTPVQPLADECNTMTTPDKNSVELPARSAISDSTIRVDVQLLDHVMNLVGELVLARNQILQFGPLVKDASFAKASARLNLLTTELQEGVMKTRMQPIGNAWNQLPRMVRDLANSCGKHVNLELEGSETELDRTIIEAIRDPLTHAVRNSVDHGIEPPSKRREVGKAEAGRLVLRAYHEGGQVNIEIFDDGAGLNIEKIRRRAIERGLISHERSSSLSDRDAAYLIFHPGFSTADAVTSVSGRGVGMDVVKTNIERVGGSVDISSTPGRGTALRIKIPLTLAIIPALIVVCRGERFAIPQVNLLELVRLEGERARTSIERLHGTALYRLRGNLLPLVFMHECLGLTHDPGGDDDVVNIVVVQAGDRQFGLVVDGISDTEEIVVKPLGKELKGITAFAGATIMGDGKAALIVDALGIAKRADLVATRGNTVPSDATKSSEIADEPKHALLLFLAAGARMAIPLANVARLEEIWPASVETSRSGLVVQYRNSILALVDMTNTLERRVREQDLDSMHMIVCEHGDATVGIIVDGIIDAIQESITVRNTTRGTDTIGSAVIQGKITDLLDVASVVESAAPRRSNAA